MLELCERKRGMGEGKGGWGESFLERQQGWGGALPAQFRRGCPSDVPLRFGTGHGERGDKGEREEEEEEAMLNSFSARDALSPHSSLLLQSGWLLDPQGRPSASLHTNSPLLQP